MGGWGRGWGGGGGDKNASKSIPETGLVYSSYLGIWPDRMKTRF